MIEPNELVEHGEALYRFALHLVRDPDLAADLVQDTLVRALERSAQYREEAPMRAWLRQILHNLAIDRARRSSRELAVDDVEAHWRDDEYTVDPAAMALRTQTREELEDALVRLPFIYRAAVILHDVEGWTVQQVAGLQAISLPAAKQRLRRGRMALVTALAEGHERRHLLEGVPMRCWDARQHISEYLDGILDEPTARMVEAHLAVCPTCPPLYAALVDAHVQLETLRDSDAVIPPDLDRKIRSTSADPGPLS